MVSISDQSLREGLYRPLSVYIHVPFCRSKCPYCAFNSFVPSEDGVKLYLSSIAGEFDRWLSLAGKKPSVRTVYVGGGTPSVLSVGRWETLFDMISRSFDLTGLEEFSVEANPESLTCDHLDLWRDRGVTRVSVGVQSLDDGELKWLGRLHGVERAVWAVQSSLAAGFDVSADLMFGLAGQSVRKWHRSLSAMVELGPHHLSLYQLTVEPQSFWGKVPPNQVLDGYGHYRWAQWYLAKKGYLQYEIASFARDGRWSRHNMAYWTGGEVLGLGPGAWGYLGGVRYENHRDIGDYSEALRDSLALAYTERIQGVSKASETAILALRTSFGLDLERFALDFGQTIYDRLEVALELIPQSCLKREGSKVRLTPKGMRIANAIWETLLWGDEDGA